MGLSDEQVREMLDRAASAPSLPRPGMTDKDVHRMFSGIQKVDSGGPGAAASFVRGLTVQGPSEIAGAVGSATDFLLNAVPGGEHLQGGGDVLPEAVQGTLGPLVGIDEPVTQAERSAQAAGSGAAFGLAAAPAVAAAGPLAVAAEMGLSTAGAFLGEEARATAEERGAGDVAQAGASMLGDAAMAIAAPAMFVAKGPDVVQGAKTLKEVWEASPEVEEVAKALGTSSRQLLGASSEFKRKFPLDPRGNEAFITRSSEDLGEAIEKYDPETIPTTRQILNKRAGSAVARLEEGLGRNSDDFGMNVEGRRQASLDDLIERYEGLRPEAAASEATRAFEVVRSKRKQAVNSLWEKVPDDEMPFIQTASMKEGAAESAARAGEFASDIPEEVSKVLEWPDVIEWEKYQQMRSRLLQSRRIGNRGAADTLAQRRASNLGPLERAMNRELDAMAGEGSDAYRKALAATREFYSDFDPRSAAVRGLEDFTEGSRIVSKIKSSKDPASEAMRARRIVEQEPGGLEGLQRIFMDDLVGLGDLDSVSFKAAQKRLRKHESSARVVMGDEGFESAMDILDRARIASVGNTGKAAAASTTGSNIGALDVMLARASDFKDPSVGASDFVVRMIQKTMKRDGVRIGILREAMLDPAVAKTLLDLPTDRAVEAWAVNWMKLVRRVEAGRIVSKDTGGEK